MWHVHIDPDHGKLLPNPHAVQASPFLRVDDAFLFKDWSNDALSEAAFEPITSN